ncbi:MAG: hypothetical protein R2827_07450 [Bdellovibrionales bacterium]
MNKFVFLIVLCSFGVAFAAPSKNSQKPELSTEMNFNGLNINGKYNSPGETSIVVEEEKSLNNLISIRKQFKDRITEEMKREIRC